MLTFVDLTYFLRLSYKVSGITINYYKYPSIILNFVHLPQLTILSIVSVYQLVHIYLCLQELNLKTQLGPL